jgi:hypothetical protein
LGKVELLLMDPDLDFMRVSVAIGYCTFRS